MKEFMFSEGNVGDKLLDESKFLEIANESVERRKQNSFINTTHMTAATGRDTTTGRELSPTFVTVNSTHPDSADILTFTIVKTLSHWDIKEGLLDLIYSADISDFFWRKNYSPYYELII